MITEDEAKKKWCPHVRHSDSETDSVAVNRFGRHAIDPERSWNSCIGSACMAWRWKDLPPVIASDDLQSIPVSELEMRTKARRGYCGLSGRPA